VLIVAPCAPHEVLIAPSDIGLLLLLSVFDTAKRILRVKSDRVSDWVVEVYMEVNLFFLFGSSRSGIQMRNRAGGLADA
jgi:hypothetical protein